MNLNRIFILGHVAADPENRMLPSGRPVTNIRVATNRIWNDDQGQRQESAEFHRVVTFGKLADVAGRYLTKGQLVFIEGRVQTRSWQAQDGSKRYQTEIVADGLQLGPRVSGIAPASSPDPRPPTAESRPKPMVNLPQPESQTIVSNPEDADISTSGRNVSRRQSEAMEDIPTVNLDEEDATAQGGGADDRREDATAQGGGADDRREDATPDEEEPQKIKPEDLPF